MTSRAHTWLPFAALAVCLAALHASADRGLGWILDQIVGRWLVLAAALFGAIGMAVLASRDARGARAPLGASAAFAALPWLVGIVMMQVGLHNALAFVDEAAFGARAVLLARGLGEMLHGPLLGAAISCALGLALAGIVALRARREPGRETGTAGLAALALAWAAASSSAQAASTSETYRAAAFAAVAARGDILMQGHAHALPILLLGAAGTGLFLAAAVSRAARAQRREAISLALVALLAPALHIASFTRARARLDDAARPPWHDAEIQLLAVPPESDADLITTPFVLGERGLEGEAPISNDVLQTEAGRSRVGALVRARWQEERDEEDEEIPFWIAELGHPGIRLEPEVAVLVDERTSMPAFLAFARAAEDQHARSLRLVGVVDGAAPLSEDGELARALTTPLGGMVFIFADAIDTEHPERDLTRTVQITPAPHAAMADLVSTIASSARAGAFPQLVLSP